MTTLHSNLHSGKADSGQERTLKGSYYNWARLALRLERPARWMLICNSASHPAFHLCPIHKAPFYTV